MERGGRRSKEEGEMNDQVRNGTRRRPSIVGRFRISPGDRGGGRNTNATSITDSAVPHPQAGGRLPVTNGDGRRDGGPTNGDGSRRRLTSASSTPGGRGGGGRNSRRLTSDHMRRAETVNMDHGGDGRGGHDPRRIRTHEDRARLLSAAAAGRGGGNIELRDSLKESRTSSRHNVPANGPESGNHKRSRPRSGNGGNLGNLKRSIQRSYNDLVSVRSGHQSSDAVSAYTGHDDGDLEDIPNHDGSAGNLQYSRHDIVDNGRGGDDLRHGVNKDNPDIFNNGGSIFCSGATSHVFSTTSTFNQEDPPHGPVRGDVREGSQRHPNSGNGDDGVDTRDWESGKPDQAQWEATEGGRPGDPTLRASETTHGTSAPRAVFLMPDGREFEVSKSLEENDASAAITDPTRAPTRSWHDASTMSLEKEPPPDPEDPAPVPEPVPEPVPKTKKNRKKRLIIIALVIIIITIGVLFGTWFFVLKDTKPNTNDVGNDDADLASGTGAPLNTTIAPTNFPSQESALTTNVPSTSSVPSPSSLFNFANEPLQNSLRSPTAPPTVTSWTFDTASERNGALLGNDCFSCAHIVSAAVEGRSAIILTDNNVSFYSLVEKDGYDDPNKTDDYLSRELSAALSRDGHDDDNKAGASLSWVLSDTLSINTSGILIPAISGDVAVVGAPEDNNAIGAAYAFERSPPDSYGTDGGGASTWRLVERLVPRGSTRNVGFGSTVDVHGSSIVVGAEGDLDELGFVTVFRRGQCGLWRRTEIFSPVNNVSTHRGFGHAVSVRGNTLAISSKHGEYDVDNSASDEGHADVDITQRSAGVFIYEYDSLSEKWNLLQDEITEPDCDVHFGSDLTMSNDGSLAIGCAGDNNATGAVYYYFHASGDVFVLLQKLTPSDGAPGDRFGSRGQMAMSENALVVGAGSEIGVGRGHVYIFGRSSSSSSIGLSSRASWSELARIDPPHGADGVQFGAKVALSGDQVLISANVNTYAYTIPALSVWAAAARTISEKNGDRNLVPCSSSPSASSLLSISRVPSSSPSPSHSPSSSPSSPVFLRTQAPSVSRESSSPSLLPYLSSSSSHSPSLPVSPRTQAPSISQEAASQEMSFLSIPYVFDFTFKGMRDVAQLGSSVTISGDGRFFAIGIKDAMNGGKGNTGGVFLFDSGQNPDFSPLLIYGSSAGDQFGNFIAMSDDGRRIAIGAAKELDSYGAVRIFELRGGAWNQLGDIIPGHLIAFCANGQIVAVASRGGGGSSGSVITYALSADISWTKKGQTVMGDLFASTDISGSVSLSHDGLILVVGFAESSTSGLQRNGHVTTYFFEGTLWVPSDLDLQGDRSGDHFGCSVALSGTGTRLAVGVDSHDINNDIVNSGYCVVYDWDDSASSWDMVALVSGEESNERAGSSAVLSSSGSHVACGGVGGVFNDHATGVVRILEIESKILSTIFPHYDNGISNRDASLFGDSVALTSFGDTLIVGAPSMTVDDQTNIGCAQVFFVT